MIFFVAFPSWCVFAEASSSFRFDPADPGGGVIDRRPTEPMGGFGAAVMGLEVVAEAELSW